MAVRENKVERYLDKRIESIDGITRKWVSPGVSGVPDRIAVVNTMVIFIEVKPIDGRLASVQIREHERLWTKGANVTTVYGEEGVDCLIYDINQCSKIKREYR